MGKVEPFADVTFADVYPQQDVAEHEVFMSFSHDDDAVYFREWWDEAGAAAFALWLMSQPMEEQ